MKKNIFAFLICILFVVLGIFIIHKSTDIKGFEIGFANIILFGLGCLIFPFVLADEYRLKKELAIQINQISILPGKKFYIDKLRPVSFLSVLFLSSVFFLAFSKRLDTFQYIFIGLGIFSFIFLMLVLFKKIFQETISIDFEGIHIGKSDYYFIIRFDNIKSIQLTEWNSVAYICFEFINPEDCTRYLFTKNQNREKIIKDVYKTFESGIKYFGYPYFFAPTRFKLSPAFLFRLIESYLKNPEKRSELKLIS